MFFKVKLYAVHKYGVIWFLEWVQIGIILIFMSKFYRLASLFWLKTLKKT